jgi:hypothetical protein
VGEANLATETAASAQAYDAAMQQYITVHTDTHTTHTTTPYTTNFRHIHVCERVCVCMYMFVFICIYLRLQAVLRTDSREAVGSVGTGVTAERSHVLSLLKTRSLLPL